MYLLCALILSFDGSSGNGRISVFLTAALFLPAVFQDEKDRCITAGSIALMITGFLISMWIERHFLLEHLGALILVVPVWIMIALKKMGWADGLIISLSALSLGAERLMIMLLFSSIPAMIWQAFNPENRLIPFACFLMPSFLMALIKGYSLMDRVLILFG